MADNVHIVLTVQERIIELSVQERIIILEES